jgi:dTDP-4-dehydrorhamnose 3,5-epimerase
VNIETCALPGVLLLRPTVYRDERGAFFESYHAERFAAAGMPGPFTQDNRSVSHANVLRGLHYQVTKPQGHLVTLTRGRVFDVALDLRRDSPTFGRWHSMELSADPPVQAYLPPGVAHGFCVLSNEGADIWYRCVGTYQANDEGGVLWNDPDLGIPWPVRAPILSAKDRAYPRLRDIASERLPHAGI